MFSGLIQVSRETRDKPQVSDQPVVWEDTSTIFRQRINILQDVAWVKPQLDQTHKECLSAKIP